MTRRFLTNLVNGETQLAYNHVVDNYGDYVVLNGSISNQVSLPKQVVRLRILNADVARLASIVQTLTNEVARLRALSAGQVVEMGKQSNR